MLELLFYCHMFAKLRFAGEIVAVTEVRSELVGEPGALCALAAAGGYGRRSAGTSFGFWTERDCCRSLDRLDAYCASVA